MVGDLLELEPVMRGVMNAAALGLGDYERTSGRSEIESDYWTDDVLPNVLRAIGIHELGEEARQRLKPDGPDLAADRFHLGSGLLPSRCGTRATGRRLSARLAAPSIRVCSRSSTAATSRRPISAIRRSPPRNRRQARAA